MIRKALFIYITIFAFLLVNAILEPLVPTEYFGYLSALSLLLFVAALALDGRSLLFLPRTFLPLFLFLCLHALLLLFYWSRKDLDSVTNLGALAVGYFSVYAFVVVSRRYIPPGVLLEYVFRSLLFLVVVSFFVSIVATSAAYPYAPTYYPWEAIGTDTRLLLIRGGTEWGGVGPSTVMWLAGLLLPYILLKSRFRTTFRVTISLALALILIETESRTALLLLVSSVLAVVVVKWQKLTIKYILLGMASLVLGYYFFAVNPDLSERLSGYAAEIQEKVPALRISNASGGRYDTAFVGRDMLNRVLLSETLNAPLVGQGDRADILTRGISESGRIHDEARGKRYARTESGLRLAVEYGWPYVLALLVVIFYPAWSLMLSTKRQTLRRFAGDETFMVICYITVFVALLDGVFEQLVGIDAILLLLVFLMYPHPGGGNSEPSRT